MIVNCAAYTDVEGAGTRSRSRPRMGAALAGGD
jgi:hypothetical protein